MQIHQSAEDYLECILKLSKVRPVVRSIDIANEMNYSKPSISVAMKNLRLNGYINVDESGFITLTDSGMEIAASIYAVSYTHLDVYKRQVSSDGYLHGVIHEI